jgi:hypothetical protein
MRDYGLWEHLSCSYVALMGSCVWLVVNVPSKISSVVSHALYSLGIDFELVDAETDPSVWVQCEDIIHQFQSLRYSPGELFLG